MLSRTVEASRLAIRHPDLLEVLDVRSLGCIREPGALGFREARSLVNDESRGEGRVFLPVRRERIPQQSRGIILVEMRLSILLEDCGGPSSDDDTFALFVEQLSDARVHLSAVSGLVEGHAEVARCRVSE
jgi:hypothetical protein